MSEEPKHKFVWVRGMRGPTGQVWRDGLKQESIKAIDGNSHDIDAEQCRYAISVLEGMFPYKPTKEEQAK